MTMRLRRYSNGAASPRGVSGGGPGGGCRRRAPSSTSRRGRGAARRSTGAAPRAGEKNGMPFQYSTRASAGAHAAGQLGGDGPGEHQVAPGLAHDPVAVAHDGLRLALGVARADGDLEAGLRPQPGHVGGVDLAAAGLDVGEVAPRQQVDVAEARGRGQVADLGDGIVVPQDRPCVPMSNLRYLAHYGGTAMPDRTRPSTTPSTRSTVSRVGSPPARPAASSTAGPRWPPGGAHRRDRQLPWPVHHRPGARRPRGRRGRADRPPRRQRPRAAGDHRASRPRPPTTTRSSSPTSRRPGVPTGSPSSGSSPATPTPGRRPGRPALGRRCPPLPPRPRRPAPWGDRVTPGGRMLVHDSWCSVGVTSATLVGVTPAAAGATTGGNARSRPTHPGRCPAGLSSRNYRGSPPTSPGSCRFAVERRSLAH